MRTPPRVGASLARHHAARLRYSPSPTSRSQPPSRRGTINGAPTDNYVIGSAPRSGSRRLKPIDFGLSSCGNQSTNCSVRGRTRACPSLDVESLNDFFVEKVSKVRATTCSAPSPMFSAVRDGVSLPQFSVISVDDVIL